MVIPLDQHREAKKTEKAGQVYNYIRKEDNYNIIEKRKITFTLYKQTNKITHKRI